MRFLPNIYLVDNGSLRPDATLVLRQLAEKLSLQTGYTVEPVSLLHSNKVPKESLNGMPARTVRSTLKRALESGQRDFIFLPLFLGPSRAIVDYLPELIEEGRSQFPDLNAVISDPLSGPDVEHPEIRLAEVLAAQVRSVCHSEEIVLPQVAVVDHGTPYKPVNTLRNRVAEQVAQLLEGEVASVQGASMERREGPEYDFNEPLLEKLKAADGAHSRVLVCAMFFLLPGRHAGDGGDVHEICDGLIESGRFKVIERTPLLAEHPTLINILADRLSAALTKARGSSSELTAD